MKIIGFAMLLGLVTALPFSAGAQVIPNAGFENWTNGNPDGWNTDNAAPLAVPVTKSSSGHTGTGALQGQVVSFVGFNYGPLATSLFSITQRHATLTGFYKFTSVGGDSMLITVIMHKSLSPIGFGGFYGFGGAASYTQFSIPISYVSSTIPDSCILEITIIPHKDSSDVHLGSTLVVDDLAFSGVNGIDSHNGAPLEFALNQNYPNPFNPSTTIRYSIAKETKVTLSIYNILGQQVAALVNEVEQPGFYNVKLDGTHLPSGMYFYKLQAGDFVETKRMVLLK